MDLQKGRVWTRTTGTYSCRTSVCWSLWSSRECASNSSAPNEKPAVIRCFFKRWGSSLRVAAVEVAPATSHIRQINWKECQILLAPGRKKQQTLFLFTFYVWVLNTKQACRMPSDKLVAFLPICKALRTVFCHRTLQPLFCVLKIPSVFFSAGNSRCCKTLYTDIYCKWQLYKGHNS